MLKMFLWKFLLYLIFAADDLCCICLYSPINNLCHLITLTMKTIFISWSTIHIIHHSECIQHIGSLWFGSQLTTTSTKLFGKIPSFPLMVLPLSQSLPTLDFSMIRSPAFKLSSSMLSAWKKKIESKMFRLEIQIACVRFFWEDVFLLFMQPHTLVLTSNLFSMLYM